MPDAIKQNEIRRAQKAKQRAAAKAKAVHKNKSEIDPFKWHYTATFDDGTLRSAAYQCNEEKREYLDTRGLRKLMREGKLFLKIDKGQPLIGGELIKVLPSGFFHGDKQPKIYSVCVPVAAPICLTFKMMSGHGYKNTMHII